ncbi:MAG: sodium/glutamate symporter [Marinisporobacter sp.]|nr:sodium/glutamate symporter [Marinisporobacter sp.]
MEISLNLAHTLGVSVLVLLFGKLLVNKISFLSKYCIPAPVVGGLVFSLIALFGHVSGSFSFTMDGSLKSLFMTCFFTTVGFGVSFETLKKGGVAVFLFLILTSAYATLQNIVGVSFAKFFGLNPLLGLAMGSVPLTGGHGTSAAFAPLLEQAGATGAQTVAIAAATFGLIGGCMIGGPVAKRLIEKYNLKPTKVSVNQEALATETGSLATSEVAIACEEKIELDTGNLTMAFYQVALAVGIGTVVSSFIKDLGITVPTYIGAMLIAVILRNVSISNFEIRSVEINALGEIFLSIFLAQALMSLKLWELVELAIPMMVILLVQITLMGTFAYFITFRVMGKDYDAAVLSSGHCGFGMGATPNAIANMNAVVARYFPSPKSFFVLPMVGGMFIDFTNATIITTFINIFK